MLINSNSATRVPMHSTDAANKQIHRHMTERIEQCVDGDPVKIHERLQELQREWYIDRAVEVCCAIGGVCGFILGSSVDKRLHGISAAMGLFLASHSVNGWSPFAPLLRRFGFRTRTEIDHERYALKVLRGDFHALPDHKEALRQPAAAQILHMVRC